ncbi:trigger factor [Spirochaetota bacterium]|nr:trigger factor [Spirochaetota bacterium]
MEIKVVTKQKAEDKIRLDVEFPAADLESQFDKLASEYGKQVRVPGFRLGKVPLSLIKTRFRESLRAEALEKILPKVIDQAIKEKELAVYGAPMFEDEEASMSAILNKNDKSPIKFSVSFYLPPEAKIKDPKSIVLYDHKLDVTEAEFNEAIEEETLPFITLDEVTDTIKPKDLITADIIFSEAAYEEYSLRGHQFTYTTAETGGAYPSYLNDLRKLILTMRAGMKREEKVVFTSLGARAGASEDSTAGDKAKVAGSVETTVCIAIERVKRRGAVVFNEKLLAKLGVASEAEYKERIREKLRKLEPALLEQFHVKEILAGLKKTSKFLIPDLALENYINYEWKHYVTQLKQMLAQQGADENQFAQLEQSLPKAPGEDWKQRARAKGQVVLREMLIFEELKKRYPGHVDEAAVNERISELAKEYGKTDVEAFRKELIKAGDFSRLKNHLAEQATWKEVIKNCKHKKGNVYSLKELKALIEPPPADATT